MVLDAHWCFHHVLKPATSQARLHGVPGQTSMYGSQWLRQSTDSQVSLRDGLASNPTTFRFTEESILTLTWGQKCTRLKFYPEYIFFIPPLKRTVAWDGFFAHCILSRKWKKGSKFFSCCSYIYSNTQSDIFLWDWRKILIEFWGSNTICRLPWLTDWPYGVLISCWKILAHSPSTLRAAKVQPQKKKIEILTLYPRFDGMVKKKSHATVPLSQEYDAAREFHVARLGQKLQPGKR